MKQLAIAILVLCTGCLDYEVEVETVIAKDGSAQRSVRIREKSKEHETWRRYAPPGAPYRPSGEDAKGFEAQADLRPGSHAGGLRFLREDLKGEYGGAEATKGQPRYEGRFAVRADDIEIGTLYHYVEDIDMGIDAVRFRAGLEAAVRVGLNLLVTALEVAAPERDFKPVRRNALENLAPEVTRVLLAVHSQLLIIEQRGRLMTSMPAVDDILRDPQASVILAEFERLGIHRRKDAPKTNDPEIYFDINSWTVRDSLWKRLLAPVVNNLFDSHRIDVVVRMPGRVLLTNGLMEGGQHVAWRLNPGRGSISNPSLYAWSLDPSDAMVGRVAGLPALVRFRDLLMAAPAEERDNVRKFLARARESGLDAARKLYKENEVVTALANALAPAR